MNSTQFLFKTVGRLAAFILCFTLLLISAHAVTFTVTKTADTDDTVCDADCSLREAISAANSAVSDDLIEFDPAVFSTAQTIILNGNPLLVAANGSLIINGTGANLLAVSGNDQSRVFYITSQTIVAINRITVRDGNGLGNSFNQGGGILNFGNLTLDEVIVSNNRVKKNIDAELCAGAGIFSASVLKITRSRIEFNKAERDPSVNSVGGGGIFSVQGEMTIINSSITNNTAQGNGAGINNNSLSTLNIINSTVSNNSALLSGTGLGGGIANFETVNAIHLTLADNTAAGSSGGVISISKKAIFNSQNSIYARNIGGSSIRDFRGAFTSGGYNLIENTTNTMIFGDTTGNILGQNPQLLPLAGNGGFAKSHALAADSPAIDTGKSFSIPNDQRGLFRPFDNPSIPNAPGGDGADIGAFERQRAPAAVVFDFDGDSKTDVSIFRPSNGEWWISRSSTNQIVAAQFGSSSDKTVPADFTGDGKTDIAFWRESSGQWFVLRSEDNSFYAFPFGSPGDIAAPGDFDGDGKADAAVFRPSNAVWYILRSTDNGLTIRQFGASGDQPVVADYDGDGKSDIAIFRPSVSEWWLLKSGSGQTTALQFGASGDKTVPGDYTGDGKADVAFFRPSTGEWFILRSEDFSYYAFTFGLPEDIAAPGDYDGDGKMDAAVFRPSNSVWYQLRSTSGFTAIQFGTNGDQPIPNAFVR